MSVYIEYIFLDNFIINFLLLYAVTKTLRVKAKKLRLFAAALLGTILAILLPLFEVGDIAAFAVKLGTGLLMTVLACPARGKRFLAAYLLFVLYTFALGGAAIGLLFMLKADMRQTAALIYDFDVPIGLIIAALALCVKLLFDLVKYLQRRRSVYPFLRDIELEYNGKRFRATAFIDSGNRVYDDDGSPVLVIGRRLAGKMIPKEILGRQGGEGEFRVREYLTPLRPSAMILFKIGKLLIYFEDKLNIIDVSAGRSCLT